MTMTRKIGQGALALAMSLTSSMVQSKNFGVNSVNQPVVSDTRAVVPDCPKWSGALDPGSVTDPNYGCAMNSNLAAMIANPADLLHGRSDDTTDVESAVRAVKLWHEAAPTGKLWETTTRVSIKGGGQ